MKRESLDKLLLGLGTGAAFGFLLHKGQASARDAIGGQLRLKDTRVVKIMATASAAGALGTQILHEFGLAEKDIKPLNLGGILLGGTIFGAGMAILGYCPGTGMAAMGQGEKEAAAGVVGMLGGALAFVKLYPLLKPVIEKGGLGKRTLPEITRTSPWLWVMGISAAAAATATFLNGRDTQTWLIAG